MTIQQKTEIIEAFQQLDTFVPTLTLPVMQGTALVERMRNLAAKLNAIPVDAEPQLVEHLRPVNKGGK